MTGNRINRTGYSQGTRYITEGNTVRVVRTEADPFYEREVRRKLAMERHRQRQKEEAASARRRKSISIAFPVLVALCLCVSAFLFIGFRYLSLQASVERHQASVRALETELENRKIENDALEQSIETDVDLSFVYDVAINKLGMVHAGVDNVIRYDKTESQYVRQYEQIPEF